MSLLSAISLKPLSPAKFSTSLLQFRKPNRVCAKRFDFYAQSDRIRPVSWVRLRENRKIMAGLSGVRGSNSDEEAQVFEQEAFIEGTLDSGGRGVEATVNTLSKWIVSLLFTAVVLLRHDAKASWAVVGAVSNATLSLVLKKILNQERPIANLRSDPGMPSSHAQSIFYTFTFVNSSLVEWFGINGLTTTICGLLIIAGSYFSWLRVSQQLHTIGQIVVGALVGFFFFMFWFWSWNNCVLDLFESYLWVRIFVFLGSFVFALAFLHHVFKSWIRNER